MGGNAGYGMGMVKGLVYMVFGVVGMVVVVSCYLIYYVLGWGYGLCGMSCNWYHVGRVYVLRELVLLKDLVWSISYALLKKLICSNSVLLGLSLVVISKSFRVSKIVLKCEIKAFLLGCGYSLIKLKVIHIYIIILNYFAEMK